MGGGLDEEDPGEHDHTHERRDHQLALPAGDLSAEIRAHNPTGLLDQQVQLLRWD